MIYLKDIDYRVIFILLILLLITFFYEKISEKLKLYDIPNSKRKIHNEPTSIINGFIVLICINIYFVFDYLMFKEFDTKFSIIIIVLVNIFYLLGYYDDLKDLSPKKKTFIIVVILFLSIPFDENLVLKSLIFKDLINTQIYLNNFSIFITIFFIYIFYNFLNFIDGINGVALSVCIYFLFIQGFARGVYLNFEILIIITLLLCLILNLKNISFLGNSGISALSILISLSYIREYNINQTLLCDEIFLIFLIPGIDMTRLVFSRIISGKSISDADLNHLHHYFLNFVDKKYVFIVYLIASIIPYLISKFLTDYLLVILISMTLYSLILIILTRMPKKI